MGSRISYICSSSYPAGEIRQFKSITDSYIIFFCIWVVSYMVYKLGFNYDPEIDNTFFFCMAFFMFFYMLLFIGLSCGLCILKERTNDNQSEMLLPLRNSVSSISRPEDSSMNILLLKNNIPVYHSIS